MASSISAICMLGLPSSSAAQTQTFQACEALLRDASKMICDVNVRAHLLEANLVTLFDPDLEIELAAAAAQGNAATST
eukprot:m.137491 g.137491  ORF g.137491 m.137491 type:complete len:78 (-) comp9570_c0_seq3:131-364(-)